VTGLFIRLYLDEDVDVLLGERLRACGFDAVATRDAHRAGLEDEDQLAFAGAQGRALLTQNREDFERLARDWWASSRHHSGIIIAVRRRPNDILRRLLKILDEVTADEMRDQVRYI
jgi:hypothetical protein